jgi:hypothetical protein
MAMEHFDEKIVPTFKINPHSPIAGTASVVNACDLHGSNSLSPSKILSGAFMPIAGPSYLGDHSIQHQKDAFKHMPTNNYC